MSLKLSDEVALLAVALERSQGDDEALLLVRLEFQALWVKFKRDTQAIYESYTREAREEMAAQIAADLIASQERVMNA